MKKKLFSILGGALILTSLFAAPAQAADDSPRGLKLGKQITAAEGGSKQVKAIPPAKGAKASKAKTTPTPLTTTACPSVCYNYASAQQVGLTGAEGAGVTISVHKPTVLNWDYHSVSQISVQTNSGNMVEAGYGVNPGVFGDSNPHFWMYHRVLNSSPGWGVGWVPASSPSVTHGQDINSLVGGTVTISFQHFDSSCGCTPGWWLKYGANGATPAYAGVFPDTLWTSQGETFTTPDWAQAFGEVAAGQLPSQTKMGNGSIASATQGAQITGWNIIGSGAPAADFDYVFGTTPDRWNAVATSSSPTVSARFGGPGGTETIPGVVAADDTPGVGTGSNPSGLGAFCTFQTNVSNVPKDKVTCIDGVASTACRGNVGTSAGYAPIRNVALSLLKKVTVWNNGTCSGAGLQFNHGRATLPAAYQAQANFSYRVDSVYATCATGYPTTAPTC